MIDKTPYIVARDLDEVKEVLNRLSRRQDCVQCDDSSKLTCPACASGEICQFSVPTNCSQCPKSFCMKSTATTVAIKDSSDGPSAGPIAGGVIGGIAAIAIIAYLLWRFVIKPKRSSSTNQSFYETEASGSRFTEKDETSGYTRRSSTHTVHSIASTVLTRASNIIQIAYIPGVTNRATPTSPNGLVPPVPPIPMHHSQGNQDQDNGQDDPHFFVPGNLRDSTYSGISSLSDRTSYAPRSSIASTIYGKQAQILSPAQTGMRAKPTVVSVKSAGSNLASTPPVPAIDFAKFGGITRPSSSGSDFSVGSTYLNNANTAKQGRAQVVKLGSGLKKIEIAPKSDSSSSSTTLDSTSSEESPDAIPTIAESPASPSPLGSPASPASDQGPFSDPPERSQGGISTPTLGVAPVMNDEHGRTAKTERPGSANRDPSPFGDEHATKE